MSIAGIDTNKKKRGFIARGVGDSAPPWSTILIFLLPAFILYTMFMIWPLLQAVYFSMFEFKGLVREGFVGFANFKELFVRYPLNEQLPNAFAHNLLFFLGTMLIQNTIGLLLAVVLHGVKKSKQFFQTIYTTPYLISALVVGYIWSLMLNPLFGPVNNILKEIGLKSLARPWMGDPSLALPVVILVNAWQMLGFPLLLFSAGLSAINDEVREAALVDGVNRWQLFTKIELPLLTPVIGIVTVLTFIRDFNAFGIIWAMGGVAGGPAGATDVLGLVFYRTAFQGGIDAFGLASALAVLMFIFIFGISNITMKQFRKLEDKLQ